MLIIPLGISQDNSENKNSTIKPFYSIEANFGLSGRTESVTLSSFYSDKEDVAFSAKAFACGISFAGGIEIRHYLKIGLGTGYFYYKQNDNSQPYYFQYIMYPKTTTTHGIPLFLYLRSDFLDKKITPYLDFRIGNNFLITKEEVDIMDVQGHFVASDLAGFHLKNGLYLAANIGVSFKIKSKLAINASLGYQYVSRTFDMVNLSDFFYYNDDIEYLKMPYTIIDHQFSLNIGIVF